MKNVLVVGGAGYIGCHVVLELLHHGLNPVVFDDFSTGEAKNLPDVEVVKGDICDEGQVEKVMSKDWFGLVHLAAHKDAGESMFHPDKYVENNIKGFCNVVKHFNGEKFVFSSSAAVYGTPDKMPITEDSLLRPENFYGFTKLEAERILGWVAKLKRFEAVNLRYFNAAGYDVQNRVLVGEKNPHNLIPIVMEVACGTRDKLVVFGDDYDTRDGSCVRDYVHVSDLAKAHVLALKKGVSGSFNLGSGKGFSVFEVLHKAKEVTGKNICFDVGGRREGEPGKLVASFDLAKKELGWVPKHSDLRTILETTWKLYS